MYSQCTLIHMGQMRINVAIFLCRSTMTILPPWMQYLQILVPTLLSFGIFDNCCKIQFTLFLITNCRSMFCDWEKNMEKGNYTWKYDFFKLMHGNAILLIAVELRCNLRAACNRKLENNCPCIHRSGIQFFECRKHLFYLYDSSAFRQNWK